ncbi:retrovirus-related pol polyprotein from transposon TNT 1-94 [Tanacetum coccineum]
MFKLDLEPLAPRLFQNRDVHIKYLKYAQEQADILWGIVEQVKAKQPLDKVLDFACKLAQRIQELLVYVQETCPNAINNSAKKVEPSKISDSNTPVFSSIGLKCSTSKCGSKPTGNKKNDRISQTPSRDMKNKVEAQPRKVNKKNYVVKPINDVDVKHSLLNSNSEPICATCKKSFFDGVHDMCFLDFVKNVNSRDKYAKKHKKENIWRPTDHVFTEVGLKCKPTGRTFTIVSNLCPFTRITSADVRVKKSKIIESKNANHSEPNHTWGSNATDIPSSSSLIMTDCPDCTVRFGNDHIARIIRYGDYQLGNVTISKVYYVERLGHNFFSVRQFYDGDLEVAFRKNTCFIHNLKGIDLLSGSRDTNLYTISLDDMLKTSSICLLSKASKTKSWLWHRRLSHLNFGTINKLAKDGLARGIPRLKFQKDHLCSACALGKNNGTEFVNQTLCEFYENIGISHQTFVACTPQQNGVVERRNQTLVEAARTMLIFFKAPLFLWAEAINTACDTQNHSIIRRRYNKTPYELMKDKKLDLSFVHVFGALCYPTNDNDDLGKLDAKAYIGIFIGYAPAKKAFRIYNKRT